MANHPTDNRTAAFETAERRLFETCELQVTSRRVRLADPALDVRVLETGDSPPLVLVHGSGMSDIDVGTADAVSRDSSSDRLRSARVRSQ